MKLLKNYEQFIKESFTITLDELPRIGDIVDKVDWRSGEKIAFIDFKGIKNIPVRITNGESDNVEVQVENPIEN